MTAALVHRSCGQTRLTSAGCKTVRQIKTTVSCQTAEYSTVMDQWQRNFEGRNQQFWSSVLPGHLDLPTVGGDVLTLPKLERSTRGTGRQVLCPDQEHSDIANGMLKFFTVEFSIRASVICNQAVFTPISARQLLCGNATDDIARCNLQFAGNSQVSWHVQIVRT